MLSVAFQRSSCSRYKPDIIDCWKSLPCLGTGGQHDRAAVHLLVETLELPDGLPARMSSRALAVRKEVEFYTRMPRAVKSRLP